MIKKAFFFLTLIFTAIVVMKLIENFSSQETIIYKSIAWKEYQTGSVRYQIPPEAQFYKCVNAGCYYATVTMPNNSTLAIIPLGDNQGFTLSFEKLKKTISKEVTKPNEVKFKNFPVSITFKGTARASTASNLYLLTEMTGEYQGLAIKVNKKDSMEFVLYQDKFTQEKIDFNKDKEVFEQIISTIKIDTNGN